MAEKEEKIKAEKQEQNVTSEEQSVNASTNTEEVQQSDSENANESNTPSAEEKFNELNNKYLRLYSDFDNFRKRTMKEKAELVLNANSNVIKDLLPILDDFERAISSNETTEDLNGLKEGFNLIYNKLNKILTDKGLKPMDSKGQPFDMDLHEAITNIPAPNEEGKGKVMDVVEKGYYLNEKVLRYAKVVVGQ